MRGEKQEFETLIFEKELLFAKYSRNEKQTWNLRIVGLTYVSEISPRQRTSHV